MPERGSGRSLRVLVAGAGAVGSWLGGALARGGAAVTLVARGAHGAALRRDGLGIADTGAPGASVERLGLPVRASVAEAAADGPFDVVLVAVKAFDTEGLGRELAAAPGLGVVASVQNGVGNEAVLMAALAGRRIPSPRERPLSFATDVLACTLTQPAWIVAPGVVAAGAKGGAGVAASPRADLTSVGDALVAALVAGGVTARAYADGAAMKWSKLALNLLGAATSALLGRPPSELLAERRWLRVERAVVREALAVMRALDLDPVALPGYPVPTIARLARTLPEGMFHALLGRRLAAGRADRLPGLAGDLVAGRSVSEIDALHGAVAAAGAVLGVATPVCDRASALVRDITSGRVARADVARDPDGLYAALMLGPRASAVAQGAP